MVACSDLIGTISRRYLARVAPPLPLVEIPVPELMQTRRIGVTYRKEAYLSPLAGRFIELLRENARHDRPQAAASV
jgi:DNA-binding transcriptional LysR family regulator